jgi:5-methylcytosine-specific restriction protein A
MSNAPPRPCSHPGCGVLVRDGSGRCPKHPKKAWAKPVNETKRITGRRLQAMRVELFTRKPLCEECERLGRVTLATVRDHRIPLAEGGPDDTTNEQALCEPCHAVKTKAESARGVRRSWAGYREP